MTRSLIGIGANLGDREATLRSAIESLDAIAGIEVVAVSTLRETDPVGFVTDQPRFLNGAVAVETSLGARELLAVLLRIEADHGRTREGPPGGPRTLDLDLLVHGDERIDAAGLDDPHPRLHERGFVLEPLAELGWTPRARTTLRAWATWMSSTITKQSSKLQLRKEYAAVFGLFSNT